MIDQIEDHAIPKAGRIRATRLTENETVIHADCVLHHGEHDIEEELRNLDGFDEFVRDNKADWTE